MIGLVLGMLPLLFLPVLPPPGVILWLCCPGLVLLFFESPRARLFAGLALGGAWALLQGHLLLRDRLPVTCAAGPAELVGQVVSLPRTSAMPGDVSRQRFEFQVESIAPARCSGPQHLLLSYYGTQAIIPGQRWHFSARLKKPWGLANPGSANMQAWFALSGIDAVGSVGSGKALLLQDGPPGWSLQHQKLRYSIARRIDTLPFAPDVRAVLGAITVADKSGIDGRLWSLLQQFGVNHLLVISGLHVGLVAGAGYLLGNLLCRGLLLAGWYLPAIPLVLALCCAGAYAALAGFSVPTQRALCMLCAFILASLLGRQSGSANKLLLALVIVLVINPLALLGSGLWLSFSAVGALLWWSLWQAQKPRWLRLPATHLFMSLAMVPLGAWWFGGSSLVAAPANLVMIPLVGMVIVPLALLALVCTVLAPGLEMFLWQLAAWPLQWLLPWAARVAGAAQGWLYWQLTPTPGGVLLAVAGVMLLLVPGGMRLRALALLLCLPLALPRIDMREAPNATITRVAVLDVGQGTAVVVLAGNRALVYDTGGGDPAGTNMARAVLLPFLARLGVRQLDTLVISHADNDHSAGAALIQASMRPRRVFLGRPVSGQVQGQPCVAGRAWRWPGGQRFRFLSPAQEEGSELRSNDSSCVLQLETGGHTLLLAGDIEADRERELVRYWGAELASDVLLVPHHGSRTSSSHALLKHVRPRVALVSSGYANRFGHPHEDVRTRLEAFGARVYDTADSGALEFELVSGRPLAVRQYRREFRRFWM
jgi:competence protein ComEC